MDARDKFLYSVPEAAESLGFSVRLVWSFIKDGTLKIRRVHRRTLIHRRELERFAAHDHAEDAK